MTAQDHDLAQSVAADPPAISTPASAPRRDPVDDTDTSPIRKRPRLDIGSTAARDMSAAPASPDPPAATTREQKVEMTIRSHPPSSPMRDPEEDAGQADIEPQATPAAIEGSPIIIASTEDDEGSPPVVLIEDDDDDDDDVARSYRLQLDAEDHFRRFPFSGHGSYSYIIRELPNHLHQNGPFQHDFLFLLTEWLQALPEPSNDTDPFYIHQAAFWDDFAAVVSKLLARKVPFGDALAGDPRVECQYSNFLRAYIRVCSFLFLADARDMAHCRSTESYPPTLVSYKHMRLLHNIVRVEKTPVLHLLNKEYDAEVSQLLIQLKRDFLAARGAQNLLQFLDESHQILVPKAQDSYAIWAAPILNALGVIVHESQDSNTGISKSDFYRGTLSFLEKYGTDLQDPSKVSDTNVARDTIIHFSTLLLDICQWDQHIAVELADKLLSFGDPDSPARSSPVVQQLHDIIDYRQDPRWFPILCMNAWKFKILRKYIVKGNMSLRVMSIAAMDTALVDIWSKYHTTFPSGRHPIMQYLADFLLQGQVVDYIVSVDSHPQLISRSGNIVGFLVVTHRWSGRQADAIWNTVATSTDPRVVAATMTMVRTLVPLMNTSAHLYLCKKLYDLPLERYNFDILRFHYELTQKMDFTHIRSISEEQELAHYPWDVCIRIIRETAPSDVIDRAMADLHMEAANQLQPLIPQIPVAARHAALSESAQHIAARDALCTGSVRVISMLVHIPHHEDDLFFQQHEKLVRGIVEELPSFVQTESQVSAYPQQLQALFYRLELLRTMVCKAMPNFPTDLYNDLWDHVVGPKALSNDARDMAWNQLISALKLAPGNDFCMELVSTYLPKMDPQYFTLGLFNFVANYPYDTTSEKIAVGTEKPMLQIPGADMLWPIMLSAPDGTIEDRAAQLLASRYVKIVDDPKIKLGDVEDAHVALVSRCMNELRAALEALSTTPSDEPPFGSIMDGSDDNGRQLIEVRLGRILLFQKQLLDTIRRKPEYNRAHRTDSKVDTEEYQTLTAQPVIVKYQCGNDRQCVAMDANHTIDDLYRRLCHTTGFSKVNLFAKGQRLIIPEIANTKLADYDIGGQIIVQRAEGAQTTQAVQGPGRGSSVFEMTIAKNFDELYSWMQSDNSTSRMLYDFLSSLPAPSRFADSVETGTIATRDLFPPGKVFQARYVANALRARLREQIHNSALNEGFISKSVQHLESALLDDGLISDTIGEAQKLQLCTVLVNVLLELLRGKSTFEPNLIEATNSLRKAERPSAESSASYFADGARLVSRLMVLATVANTEPSLHSLAHDAYATILEASLHSKVIWHAFILHPDFQSLHSTLLLTQSDQVIREQTKSKILSLCGDLPSTSPITRAEITASFWIAISAIIPEAVKFHGQSQQLFDIVEEVFRKNDEHHHKEEALRTYLTEWSALLLAHDHEEFVGRDEVDHLVFGLTKLLHCCILSLKSFKKPLNVGTLMTDLFQKFLFIYSINSNDMLNQQQQQLPILESTTRKKLFELMLALAEDRKSYNVLLRLMADVELDETEQVLPLNLVDRTAEVRSNTGYVGLFNPRAICYLNSLMTQLFMNQEFRSFMLSIELQDPRNTQRLLRETQKLFAEMQNSFKKSTDPRDFAALVKTLDKTPIDLSVQMDVDEFYNLLFDQWEAQLFKQEHKQKFRSFYGGQTLNQIKSKECKHVSERTEPFFAVQCDIQGKPNLHESLQAYVQGDVMEGDNKYKCESCDGKFVDAVKRTCLKEVPNNLIFHLKRFEFDLISMSRHKIYDHFAFPESIDISRYKIDHLSDPSQPCGEDVFDLVGVLVHTGTCENGHYYSYIRERPGQDSSSPPSWIEFNDSDVSSFDPAEIGDRAFGGFFESDGYNRQVKQYSAYMLFYQRRASITSEESGQVIRTSTDPPKVAIPRKLKDTIAEENKVFIREYSLFDPGHAKFVRQLHEASRKINHGTCSDDHDQENRALEIALTHLARVAWRQHTVDTSLDLLIQLRRSTLSCARCCGTALIWLGADEQALRDMFFRSTHPRFRAQLRDFLIDSLKYLRNQEPALYGADPTESEMDIDSTPICETVLPAIVKRLRFVVNESSDSFRGWEDFYLTMTQLAELGSVETAAILNEGFLTFCLKLFCLPGNPAAREQSPGFAHIMDKRRCIFNRLIGFISKLLSDIDLSLTAVNSRCHDRYSVMDVDVSKFPVSKEEEYFAFMFNTEYNAYIALDKILELFDDSKTEHFYPGDITKWMFSAPMRHVPRNMLSTFREGYSLDPPYCDTYVRASLAYCETCPIADNIKQVLTSLSETVTTPKRPEDRSIDAELVVALFTSLLKIENDEAFEGSHPHVLHEALMEATLIYAMPLLCHFDAAVRKATHVFLTQLYRNDEAIPSETVTMKYTTIRELLPAMMVKIAYEKDAGMLRSTLTPLVETCRVLIHQLFILTRDDDDDTQEFKHVNDTALITQYHQEIEPRLRMWPQDQGTPLSAGDRFDQSDYGSESDDAQEIVDGGE